MSDSGVPIDCSAPDSSAHGVFQARVLERVAIFYSRGSSWPRDGTYISCIGRGILHQGGIKGATGKPKNTGVGILLGIFQGIFLTQKLNQGLLHCRWILYQLSYQPVTLTLISIQYFAYEHTVRSMGSQRVRHDWVTELNWYYKVLIYSTVYELWG